MHNEEKIFLLASMCLAIIAGTVQYFGMRHETPEPIPASTTTAYVSEKPIFTTAETTNITTLVTTTITTTPVTTTEITTTTEETVLVIPDAEPIVYEYVEEPVIFVKTEPEPIIEVSADPIIEYSYSATDDEIDLLARIAICEAGYVEQGRRYVIDTILNRVDSSSFPDSIYGVAYQSYQFSVVGSGAIWNVSVSDYDTDLVKQELTSRSSYSVGYFWAGGYCPYGTPLFECGGNYFSSIN